MANGILYIELNKHDTITGLEHISSMDLQPRGSCLDVEQWP